MLKLLKGRFTILLLAIAVFASQVIATQHMHADDDASACYVCGHADNVPATASSQEVSKAILTADETILPLPAAVLQAKRHNRQVRAPPHL